MSSSSNSKVARVLYRELRRSGQKWLKLQERASYGTKEAPSLLQDLAFRSVKANATQWTSPLKDGVKELYETDKFLSHAVKVNGEYGSASYHGLDGLRTEFKRVSNDSEETHERIDAGFTLLKWLNRGTMFASRILDNLEPRGKPPNSKFSLGDIIWHKEHEWRAVVFGWGPISEAGNDWKPSGEGDGQHFYYLLCNDGKLRYGEEHTHERVEGPLTFLPEGDDKDIASGKKHLDMYFHAFSDAQAAYVPNAHLARRYPDERWTQFIEDEALQEKFPDYIPE